MGNINKTYVFETVLISGGTSGTTLEFFTGATFDTGTGNLDFITNSGTTINVPLDGRYSLTGHTHSEYTLNTAFTAHTADTSIHFTKNSISLSDLGSTAHTHTVSEVTDFPTNISYFTNDAGYLTGATSTANDYVTGATFNLNDGVLEFTRLSGDTFNVNLDNRYAFSSGHTHDISEITGFTDNSTDWDNAFLESITGMTVTGTTTKTIILEQRDGSVITANFIDDNTGTGSGDVVTGMTFNAGTGILELRTLSGSTIQESLDGRYLTGYTPTVNTDDYLSGVTFDTSTGILEFVMVSGTTFNVNLDNRYSLTGHTHNLSELNNDVGFITGATSTADDYLSGGTFNVGTGDLDLIRLSGETVTINLDGRYIVAGPITFSAETSGTTTYVGYGTVNACKIRKIDTVSGSTYTAYWSEGSETLDKIWANRYTYSYF